MFSIYTAEVCDCGKGAYCPQYGAAFNVRKLSVAELTQMESEALYLQRQHPTQEGWELWDEFNREFGRRIAAGEID